MFHEGFSILIEALWELNLASQDVLVNSHGVIVIEGIDSGIHFVDEHTQSPPVYSLSMALIQNNFRSNVFWSSTDCERSPFIKNLGKTKVSQL